MTAMPEAQPLPASPRVAVVSNALALAQLAEDTALRALTAHGRGLQSRTR